MVALSWIENAQDDAVAVEHTPVLYQEVMHALNLHAGDNCIDATVGLGGHACGILEASAPDGRLLALDADPEALAIARHRLSGYGERVTYALGYHRDLGQIARDHGFVQVRGILFDLGVSSLQLDRPERGFSFRHDGPLDMRMGPGALLTAGDIVNTWSEERLADVIYRFGEERYARQVARALCEARPLRSTQELAEAVARAVHYSGGIHPATRTFQALRIAANDELESLRLALPQAVELLAPGGRLVVLAFHSLEDRIVKQFLTRESRDCVCPPRLPQCVCEHRATLRRVNRKPIRPHADEVAANPRCRSVRMRVAERLA
ncbi:MAG: 16S rRNA (cytosine(1402)-N(4))-methyltransferase RsmH [Chloroflexi bacterium]|nr:16S rRNA (cytosine(1402)-N(4))-methyltransferase RsmH [Chloroflexota bacterium]